MTAASITTALGRPTTAGSLSEGVAVTWPRVPVAESSPFAVSFHASVCDAHRQSAGLNGFGEIHKIGQHLAIGAHHTCQLYFADTQCVTAPQPAAPAEIEAGQLPKPVKPKATGHNRVARKVAIEEPEIGSDIKLGNDMALTMFAAVAADVGDPVHHQHWRFRELGVAGPKELAPRAGQQCIAIECCRKFTHLALPFVLFVLASSSPIAKARIAAQGPSQL